MNVYTHCIRNPYRNWLTFSPTVVISCVWTGECAAGRDYVRAEKPHTVSPREEENFLGFFNLWTSSFSYSKRVSSSCERDEFFLSLFYLQPARMNMCVRPLSIFFSLPWLFDVRKLIWNMCSFPRACARHRKKSFPRLCSAFKARWWCSSDERSFKKGKSYLEQILNRIEKKHSLFSGEQISLK